MVLITMPATTLICDAARPNERPAISSHVGDATETWGAHAGYLLGARFRPNITDCVGSRRLSDYFRV